MRVGTKRAWFAWTSLLASGVVTLACSSTATNVERGAGGSGGDAGSGASSSGGGGGTGGSVGGSGPCVRSLSLGNSHTCVATKQNAVWCWGQNHFGELGDGTLDDSATPKRIDGAGEVDWVSAGGESTCVRRLDGSIWCWGRNAAGELGLGTTTGDTCGSSVCRAEAQEVKSLGTDVKSIALGSHHGCALKTDGSVWCWGENQRGELGRGLGGPGCDGGCDPTPTAVPGLQEVTQIVASQYRTCARKSDGTAWCWGQNTYGYLGDGTNAGVPCGPNAEDVCRTEPVQVAGLGQTVFALLGTSCALDVSGSVWCWGNDGAGLVGDGPGSSEQCGNYPCALSPVKVDALGSNVTSGATGLGHACALRTTGALWCWGRDAHGELGDETKGEACTFNDPCRMSPVPVIQLGNDVKAVSVGALFTCALVGDGEVRCWGANTNGELGGGTTSNQVLKAVDPTSAICD